jgi:DNA replication initiation complex subunit (GINS family)
MLDKELIKKEIDKLPEDILAEVFDFIRYLESKRERDLLVKSSQKLSTTSFQRIWDNEEDAVYDKV